MSFALEFRKKHYLTRAQAKAGGERASRAPKARTRAETHANTRASRTTVLGALLMAGAILAVFNSEGLRLWVGDLAERGIGRPLLALSEAWDSAMERVGTKAVLASVRGLAAEAREASWDDLAGLVGAPGVEDGTMTAGQGAPPDYTGALPEPQKHGTVLDDFSHSGAGGR
jgi:hypothetical protein